MRRDSRNFRLQFSSILTRCTSIQNTSIHYTVLHSALQVYKIQDIQRHVRQSAILILDIVLRDLNSNGDAKDKDKRFRLLVTKDYNTRFARFADRGRSRRPEATGKPEAAIEDIDVGRRPLRVTKGESLRTLKPP